MAEEAILTWNFANWVTILLMVILGFAILGLGAKLIKSRSKVTA